MCWGAKSAGPASLCEPSGSPPHAAVGRAHSRMPPSGGAGDAPAEQSWREHDCAHLRSPTGRLRRVSLLAPLAGGHELEDFERLRYSWDDDDNSRWIRWRVRSLRPRPLRAGSGAGDYEQALAEVRAAGSGRTGCGTSSRSSTGWGSARHRKRYAIKSVAEAEAYLRHPVLGPRLVECAEAAVGVEGRSAVEIFGSPDDMKLQSCATLFACVSPAGVGVRAVARQVLSRAA